MSWAARNLAAYLATGPRLITPNTGALTLSGNPASIRPLNPASAALALTGQTPVIRQTIRITPQSGALTLTGAQAGAASQSQIISREYIGTGGTDPRSFSSEGFVPLFVIVVGKDGSGNVVGSLKSHLMPAGQSQPFLGNVPAGNASRANRILTIDANGFTVGPDLNVNGRNYAYIMFPAGRFGAVTAGTYTGAATSSPGAGTIGVSASQIDGQGPGSTQFVTAANCEQRWFRPAGNTVYTPGTPLIKSGRRMIRNSDGAVLAECAVGGFINQSSCFGTGYILGNEAAYHWEEQYIELNTLVPDMLLLMADDATGVFVPATFCPPPNVPTTNRSWDGSGGGSLFAYFVSATESVLHIFDTGGTSYNSEGTLYHWLALKGDGAGSGGVRIKSFQYTGTGDGPYPIELTGCGFDPEWAYVQGGNDQFHWSKRAGSGILGNNVSRRWIDGTGDHILVNPAYTITFISDGVELPATNSAYNVLGVEYTVTLIGVSAPAEDTQITPQTGSLIITPTNPVVAQTRLIRPNTGTLTFQGRAAKTKETHTPGPPPKKRNETPDTGELQITGRQAVLKIGITPGTGTLTATGQRCFVRPPDFLALPQAGTLTLTGQQPTQRITITPGTGALALNGQAAILNQSVPPRRTINTADLTLVAYQAILKTSIIPNTGELQLQTFNTEPIVQTNVTKITPITGTLNFLAEQVVLNAITPNTGSLTLVGQQPIVIESGGAATITPNTGSLILTGRPVTVVAPSPTPPTPTPTGVPAGGPALPTPRKLPFWPRTIIVARGRIVQPAASFRGRGRAEENELDLLLMD